MDDGVVTGTRAPRWGVGTKPWRARRAEAALVGGTADPAAFRRAAAQRGQGLTSPSGRSCAAASTACREAVVTAVGTPVARVDGPAKVTGARPATRRRSACLQWHLSGGRRADDRQRTVAIDADSVPCR